MSKFTNKKLAFSLVEIVLAMAILAATMVPIFFFISKSTTETDYNVSRMFAISRASEILNAMLDNVPFQALRAGIPGHIKVDDLANVKGYKKFDDDWAQKFVNTVFPGSVENKTAAGYPCQCVISDPRGMHYKITLRVEDIVSPKASAAENPPLIQIGEDYPTKPPNEFSPIPTGEVTFSFLKNPARLQSPAWHKTIYIPNPIGMLPGKNEYRYELELPKKVSENYENFYRDDGYTGVHPSAPRFKNPTATRFTQRMAKAKVSYTKDENFCYCGLKRLIIEVQWNIEPAHIKNPEKTGPGLKRIHLMTIKADINV